MRTATKIAAICGLALSVAACGGQEDANAIDANATSTTEPLEPIEGTSNDMMSVDAANNMSGGMMNDTMTTNSMSSGGMMSNNMMSNNMMMNNMSDMSTNTMSMNSTTTTTNAM